MHHQEITRNDAFNRFLEQQKVKKPTPTTMINFLEKHWDSQGNGAYVLGVWLENINGSFKDALAYAMAKSENMSG